MSPKRAKYGSIAGFYRLCQVKNYAGSVLGYIMGLMASSLKIDKRTIKKSYQALNVANEVIRKFKAGEHINLTDIQVRNGYQMASARAQKAIKTKTFQDAILPVLDGMDFVHKKAIAELIRRDFSKERMDSVVNAGRQMVHDSQLLSGKATENIAQKIVVYGSEDFMTAQLERGGESADIKK